MRISDWSSDVCSSDLLDQRRLLVGAADLDQQRDLAVAVVIVGEIGEFLALDDTEAGHAVRGHFVGFRSEEHTSELQSLMRISYAVFCLKKKKKVKTTLVNNIHTKLLT